MSGKTSIEWESPMEERHEFVTAPSLRPSLPYSLDHSLTIPSLSLTGMLLELDNSELRQMLEVPESLRSKVREAVTVLRDHQMKEQEQQLVSRQLRDSCIHLSPSLPLSPSPSPSLSAALKVYRLSPEPPLPLLCLCLSYQTWLQPALWVHKNS